MTSNVNIDTFINEAVRLIDLEKEVLEKIRDTEGLLESEARNEEKKQTFDQKSIDKDLKILTGERHKVQNKDMVVAVVGTMKAGKSMTINAIVGSEVLPNRNEAMTSIPTMIRHKPGKVTPGLKIENPEPMNAVAQKIREALPAKTYQEVADELSARGVSGNQVFEFIQRQKTLVNEYEGRDAIFDFLWIINDIIRLCSSLNIEFPFYNYDEVHELPVIEVEFAHLKGNDDTQGTLTLLDTPGPNEAGQSHLAPMLQDQLSKASAILSVLNYTQLRTSADQDLRTSLHEIANISEGRIFALINKFDQKGPNDPGKKEIVPNVADNLFEGNISQDDVFPVSALEAWLANTALSHMQSAGTLPQPNENEWVEQFGEIAMGRTWERRIDDIDEVTECAQSLWQDSGFAEALEKVIVSANRKAAIYALDSAAAKLTHYGERISNFVNGRSTALQKETEELQNHIQSLKSDLSRIENLKEQKEKDAKTLFNDLDQKMNEYFKNLRTYVNGEAENYFSNEETKKREESQESADEDERLAPKARAEGPKDPTIDQRKRNPANGIRSILSGLLQSENGHEGQNNFRDREEIEFSDKEEASKFVKDTLVKFQEMFEEVNSELQDMIENYVTDFNEEINKTIMSEVADFIEKINQRFGESGFNVSFEMPENLALEVSGSDSKLIEGGIRKDAKTVTRIKEKEGVLSKAARWVGDFFDTDWGYEEYEKNIDVYKVRLSDIRELLDKFVNDQIDSWKEEVDEKVRAPLWTRMEEFFAELAEKITMVRNDLLQGIEDQEKSENKKQELIQFFSELINTASDVKWDASELREESQSKLQEF